MILPIVNAETVFKKDTQSYLILSCFEADDSFCTNETTCTITINSPEGNIINNQNMTYNIAFFNYTIPASNLSINGEYKWVMQCDNGSTGNGNEVDHFQVTPSGTIPSTSQGMLYSFLLLILLVGFAFSTVGAFVINGKNEYDLGGNLEKINLNKHTKLGLFFLSYLLLIFIIFTGWQISLNFLFLTFTSMILKMIHTILWILLFPVFIGFVAISLVKFVLDAKIHELAERGLKPYGGKRP